MKIRFLVLSLALCLLASCRSKDDRFSADKELDYCSHQVNLALSELRDSVGQIQYCHMPQNIMPGEKTWNCRKCACEEWCGGFWPGILWYDYEHTHNDSILQEAKRFTEQLAFLIECPVFDHDLGFLMLTSYGNGYRLTHNPEYKEILLAAADTLATLFNPTVGTLLSWPRNVEKFGGHNTIMDNMINLELLFWAAKNGGDQRLAEIATSHADKTMKYAFRPDYTSYHVVVYDTITGEYIKAITHQGYADNTMWARGQAWAIYGYTMVYRETHEERFLLQAQKVAEAYLSRLPEDYVPYWDFDYPFIPNAPRDASSAAIVASALLELQSFVTCDEASKYRDAAMKMLENLSSEAYQSRDHNCAFLMHSTGNLPAGTEIDASIVYADYYYIEALTRLKNL